MDESLSEPLVKQIEHRDVRELRMNRPPVNALTGEFLAQLRCYEGKDKNVRAEWRRTAMKRKVT
jgi:hypothetical protein